MIKATRHHFFVNTIINYEKERQILVEKFVENDMYPKVIQEAPWAVISILSLTLVVIILEFLN